MKFHSSNQSLQTQTPVLTIKSYVEFKVNEDIDDTDYLKMFLFCWTLL